MLNQNKPLNDREVMAARKQSKENFKENYTKNSRFRNQNQEFNDKLTTFRQTNPEFSVSVNGSIITMFKPNGEMAAVYNSENGLMNINCPAFKAHMGS
jgi:hypothetical protein